MEFEFSCQTFNTFFIYKDLDDNAICRFYADSSSAIDEMLRDVSQMIFFISEGSDKKIERICVKGRDVEYAGWQSDMIFEYIDKSSGKIIWSCAFPQWE